MKREVHHNNSSVRSFARPGVDEFLDALYGKYYAEQKGFIFVTTRNKDGKTGTRYFPCIEALGREVWDKDQQVFIQVCPVETMKNDKNRIQFVPAFWAGVDIGPDGFSGKENSFKDEQHAARAVRLFPLPPSIIVHSGRGLHLYWVLRTPLRVEDHVEVESLLSDMNSYFRCRKPIPLTAGLRLPSALRSGPGEQDARGKVKFINTDFVYDMDEIHDCLRRIAHLKNSRGKKAVPLFDEMNEVSNPAVPILPGPNLKMQSRA